jgi:hypothetical protein
LADTDVLTDRPGEVSDQSQRAAWLTDPCEGGPMVAAASAASRMASARV